MHEVRERGRREGESEESGREDVVRGSERSIEEGRVDERAG